MHGLDLDPWHSGWQMKDGQYDIGWYEGEQMPRYIENNIDSLPDKDDEDMVAIDESDSETED